MTAEATEQSVAKPLQKGWMSPARKRQLLTELAIGEISTRQLAHKYSLHYSYLRTLKAEHREEIEEIRAEIADKERDILWPTDRFARNYERITDLVQINEEMERHRKLAEVYGDVTERDEMPTSEHWLRLVAQKQAILKAIAEDYGQLPTRTRPPASSVGLVEEIIGFDS